MTTLYWMHDEALRLSHPASVQAGEDSHQFFIWDDDYLQLMDYGFHRLHFIYEAVCALNIPIYKGNTQEVIADLAHMHDCTELYCADTPNQALQHIMHNIAEDMQVIRIADDAFVELSKHPELKRFFRYWNKAEKLALLRDGKIK
jgi:hypothetical protein